MLIGYVSDQRYVALPGALLELENETTSVEARSTASGAFHANIEPGQYKAILSLDGYGAKTGRVTLSAETPHQFRLLEDRLLGYMWPKWSSAGEYSQFCVHSPEEYKLELWRYGHEKEFIRTLGWYDEHAPRSTALIAPDGDFTQFGVRWSRPPGQRPHSSQQIMAPDRSGLYYLHAKTISGQFFSFPWIVQPKEPQCAIAVLTSNITWNAYNNFGGRSNYVSQDGLTKQPTVNARQELHRYTTTEVWPYEETAAPLSFERPELFNSVPEGTTIYNPIEGRLESAMAAGEWRLLGWLEREGFAYDLYSETELHFDRIDLEKYRMLILNTHPEYWSKEMYFRAKDWVDNKGGKLVYLGGCGMYAELEFVDESVMLCRIEGEATLRGQSEANLLGVAYTHSGYQSGAPYRVIDDSHWVFAETGLSKGDLFGGSSLHRRCPGGASGHELDKLSPHSPANIQHLAKGDNGGADGADMTLYETDRGGAVFSVGSLCWTLSILLDEGVSKVTTNVLNKFLEVR